LHSGLNTPKEGSISYNDFSTNGLVLISDEAHHMNGAVNANLNIEDQLTLPDMDDYEQSDNWETTVMRIFRRPTEDGKPNVLLEFTATEDLSNPNIAAKYADKIIYDYPLKKFRADKFSKEIAIVQSDATPIERALQAVVLSQYKRKLFEEIKQAVKPVIMFKSNSIPANKAFIREFAHAIKNLSVETLLKIRQNAEDDVLSAFTYFEAKGINYENLILELQEDFREDKLLRADGKNISLEIQSHLNSMESSENEYRAVFAVELLNEGWDVLNLFDIVKLYDTKTKQTTNAEAQLIGRGARYMPFSVPGVDVEKGKRKFDCDLTNRLRVCETLHYHSIHNPQYIQDLHKALVNTGIMTANADEVTERIKDSFKETRLYRDGYVFMNERVYGLGLEDVKDIGNKILEKEYFVTVRSGAMEQSSAFGNIDVKDKITMQQRLMTLGDFSNHVIRAAINRLPEYTYSALHRCFPNLKSVKEFVESDAYLAKIKVKILGNRDVIDNLPQREQLNVVVDVLRQISPMLPNGHVGMRGTRVFKAKMVKNVFKDHTLKVDVSATNEEGLSIMKTTNLKLRCNVDEAEWFAYDDNFGTNEEKYLIKYIEGVMPKLREKYEEVYLVRNEKDLKIYDFETGEGTEPDFVLFMRRKNGSGYDNIQVFIEPKGAHLRAKDMWKDKLLKSVHSSGTIQFNTQNQDFEIWGMPLYTETNKAEFMKAMQDNFGV
jgi:type III restriction enzyme